MCHIMICGNHWKPLTKSMYSTDGIMNMLPSITNQFPLKRIFGSDPYLIFVPSVLIEHFILMMTCQLIIWNWHSNGICAHWILVSFVKLCSMWIASVSYCHYCYCKNYVDGISDCVQACIKVSGFVAFQINFIHASYLHHKILETNTDVEAKFRAAVGIGTLVKK